MKTIIRIVAIATIAMNYNHSYSQSTKPLSAQPATKLFSGELGDGKISYNYYEDTKTGVRVRHGAFKYSEYTASEGSVYSVLFTGSYKNGFKDGPWKYLISRKDIPLDEGVYQTGSISVLLSYRRGCQMVYGPIRKSISCESVITQVEVGFGGRLKLCQDKMLQ